MIDNVLQKLEKQAHIVLYMSCIINNYAVFVQQFFMIPVTDEFGLDMCSVKEKKCK